MAHVKFRRKIIATAIRLCCVLSDKFTRDVSQYAKTTLCTPTMIFLKSKNDFGGSSSSFELYITLVSRNNRWNGTSQLQPFDLIVYVFIHICIVNKRSYRCVITAVQKILHLIVKQSK